MKQADSACCHNKHTHLQPGIININGNALLEFCGSSVDSSGEANTLFTPHTVSCVWSKALCGEAASCKSGKIHEEGTRGIFKND